ncbi:MAG TPA: histidine phosphatase family protein [Acidimicrobiales bacterium]|nr:histidine phosphatase family protein [Acidimicrobiales bacterium]
MILVRHATPMIDPAIPPPNWRLTPEGAEAAELLGRELPLPATFTVMASTERKAIETASAITRSPVGTSAAFCEVTRPWYDGPAVLEQHAARWFGGDPVDGWEPRGDAVARFARGVLVQDPDNLIVVTHGTVMTAWLVSIGMVDDAMAFWTDLLMPDAWEVGHNLVRCP